MKNLEVGITSEDKKKIKIIVALSYALYLPKKLLQCSWRKVRLGLKVGGMHVNISNGFFFERNDLATVEDDSTVPMHLRTVSNLTIS